MQPAKHLDRHAGIDRPDVNWCVVHAEICFAAGNPCRLIERGVALHIVDVGEALCAQQLSGEIQPCPAIGATDPPRQADSGCFGRWLSPAGVEVRRGPLR